MQKTAALVERAKRVVAPPVRDVMLPVTQLQDFVSCPRRFHLAHQVGLAERPISFEWREDDEEAAPVGDVRVLGTATHKLLELSPLEWIAQGGLKERLTALQRTSGLPTDRDDEVVSWAQGFWMTKYGQRLPTARRVLRELPFVLRLSDGDFALHLRGQIDLLVIDERVEVIDYKTTTPSEAGLAPYAFQLGCYALAARRIVQAPGVEVRAGISYLRHHDVEPRFLESLPDEAALERELVGEAKRLIASQNARQWALRERPTCLQLGCGYVTRCHGAST